MFQVCIVWTVLQQAMSVPKPEISKLSKSKVKLNLLIELELNKLNLCRLVRDNLTAMVLHKLQL